MYRYAPVSTSNRTFSNATAATPLSSHPPQSDTWRTRSSHPLGPRFVRQFFGVRLPFHQNRVPWLHFVRRKKRQKNQETPSSLVTPSGCSFSTTSAGSTHCDYFSPIRSVRPCWLLNRNRLMLVVFGAVNILCEPPGRHRPTKARYHFRCPLGQRLGWANVRQERVAIGSFDSDNARKRRRKCRRPLESARGGWGEDAVRSWQVFRAAARVAS